MCGLYREANVAQKDAIERGDEKSSGTTRR
jgi:hypothetical protein